MSTLTVDIFLSADGFARGETSPGYFGYMGPDLDEWINSEAAAPQLVVLGRVTYEALASIPPEARDDGWQQWTELPKVVFTRTLTQTDWPNTRLCHDLEGDIRRLKEGDVELRTMGSVSLARQLIDAGLVDRLRLMTFPLVVGDSGRDPFFADIAATELELTSSRILDGRIVLTEYRPTGTDIPRT
ncbi:dihydrofolate reductase family protein [Jiangella muralis]|uniref:dihydrofolate reductase family protein n=1 Tax=Jiangella muralis TaxID=702383 RepID=UPI00069CC0A1|nr:dihydrofolate reductase family protein [Jiangella muralis]